MLYIYYKMSVSKIMQLQYGINITIRKGYGTVSCTIMLVK